MERFKEKRTRELMIQVRVTPEERHIIEKRAETLGMPIAPYTRAVAMNPQIIKWNWDAIDKHSQEINTLKNCVIHMVYGMRVSGRYTTEEVRQVANILEEIAQSEKELLGAVLDEMDAINKQARRKQLVLPQGTLGKKPEPTEYDTEIERLKTAFDTNAAKASNAYRELVHNPKSALALLMAAFWAGSCYALGKALSNGPGESRRVHMAREMLARILRGYKLDADEIMRDKGVL